MPERSKEYGNTFIRNPGPAPESTAIAVSPGPWPTSAFSPRERLEALRKLCDNPPLPRPIDFTNTLWWLNESKMIFGHFNIGRMVDCDGVTIVVRLTEREVSIRIIVDSEEKGHLVDMVIE